MLGREFFLVLVVSQQICRLPGLDTTLEFFIFPTDSNDNKAQDKTRQDKTRPD